MKRSLTRLTLLLLGLNCFETGSSAHRGIPESKKLAADYVFIPAGYLNDSLIAEFYISSIEVTNIQYREFLKDLQSANDTAKLKMASVDTSRWAAAFPKASVFSCSYFQRPAYDQYPVVNITKRGAELYCQWLTEKYNTTSRQKAHFALPTEDQWTYAAKGGNPKAIYPWPGKSLLYDKKGKSYHTSRANYRRTDSIAFTTKEPDAMTLTAPSKSYLPNSFEIYNMAGNVAEMLSDQDYTKGGSWDSPEDRLLISASESADLTHGAPTIGFRPVMILDQ